jgi:pimeloyl-ACP methyl ester carboxylesterase
VVAQGDLNRPTKRGDDLPVGTNQPGPGRVAFRNDVHDVAIRQDHFPTLAIRPSDQERTGGATQLSAALDGARDDSRRRRNRASCEEQERRRSGRGSTHVADGSPRPADGTSRRQQGPGLPHLVSSQGGSVRRLGGGFRMLRTPGGWCELTYRFAVKISLALALGVAAPGCAADIGGSGQPSVPESPAETSAAPVPTQAGIGPFPDELVQGLRSDVDIAYTQATDCGGTPCTVPGDVLAPADWADLPTIVMLGGGSTPFADRRYQGALAAELAERGAVVFLMAYRSPVTGNYDSDSWNDLRCAVRYARAATEEYGGDPSRIVVVGHSQGGLMALDVAIQPEEQAEACLADGSGKPDAVVALGSPSPSFAGTGGAAPPMWLFCRRGRWRLRGHGPAPSGPRVRRSGSRAARSDTPRYHRPGQRPGGGRSHLRGRRLDLAFEALRACLPHPYAAGHARPDPAPGGRRHGLVVHRGL